MTYSKEEKAMWLEDWRHSGKGAWGYAKANGLNPQTFVRWTKSESENKTNFVELSSTPVYTSIVKPSQYPHILIEKGDVTIRIPLVIRSNELRAVMEGLGASL